MILLLLSIGILALLFLGGIWIYPAASSKSQNIPIPTQTLKTSFNVAVLTADEHFTTTAHVKGFMNALQEHYDIDVAFNHFYKPEISDLKACIKRIATRDVDLIYTFGYTATKTAQKVLTTQNEPIPLVFGGISYTEKSMIVANNKQQSFVTGVIESKRNYVKQVALLEAVLPTVKTVVVVCDINYDSEIKHQYDNLIKELKVKNILVEHLFTSSVSQDKDKISALLASADALLTLTDPTTLNKVELLIDICNTLHVPLFASEGGSVKKGAAIGFGKPECDCGTHEAELAYKILKGASIGGKLPIIHLNENERLLINEDSLGEQGIAIDPQLLLLMKYIDTHEESMI